MDDKRLEELLRGVSDRLDIVKTALNGISETFDGLLEDMPSKKKVKEEPKEPKNQE